MPNLPKKAAKQLVEQYAGCFNNLIGKDVCILFGPHNDILTTLESVKLIKQADVKNLPDKRKDGDKHYTPLLMGVQCDGLLLVLVLEDIQEVLTTVEGVILYIGDKKIIIKEVMHDTSA